jgi:hypothetical protein
LTLLRLVLNLIFPLLLLAACSGGQSTPTKFVISFSALNGGNFYPGGLLLQLTGPTGQVLTYELTSSYQLDIPNGTWTFQVVGFQGPESWRGEAECGSTSNVSLSGPDATVTIEVTATACAQPVFVTMMASKGAIAKGTWDTSNWDEVVWDI